MTVATIVETHYLMPWRSDEAFCGAEDRGPLDLNFCGGDVSCERCNWQWGIAHAGSPSRWSRVWLRERGDTVRLRGHA